MKLREVEQGYSRSAKKYDELLHFWFGTILRLRKYRQDSIKLLELTEGDAVLDIGCGTGENFSLLQSYIGESGTIIGVDYTQAMLEQAKQKVVQNGWRNVILKRGDAVHVDKLVPQKVDAIISSYCFGILYDAEKAFRNGLTCLKKGKKISILDFGAVQSNNQFIRLFYPLYSRIVRKYHISSDEDLDEDGFSTRRLAWQRIAWKKLKTVKEKSFLFGLGLLYVGEKK